MELVAMKQSAKVHDIFVVRSMGASSCSGNSVMTIQLIKGKTIPTVAVRLASCVQSTVKPQSKGRFWSFSQVDNKLFVKNIQN